MVTVWLEAVGAAYGAKPVLSGVTTPAFHGGTVIAVIGPNAAGKSTLFKRIAGIMKGPGKVHLEGVRDPTRAVSYLPQDDTPAAALTVYESILLARKQGGSWRLEAEDLTQVDRAIADLQIGAIGFCHLHELSGGQRQLVGIAQSLVREPDVLLMDEPTSALDLCRQVEVLLLLRRLAKERGMAVFIALHDLNHALHFADMALLVADGTAQACGACDEVITDRVLREVYNVEGRIERCSMGRRHVIVDGVAARPAAGPAEIR
ncbi:ABC transporter ATP-binding protein [Arenibaculum pallidiluteum]|uniref:ABC transporter ATP-binding protein n=1 Tax=Arenibaculum pallidiluteum TaxID=2812559 RepID=UPI001A960E1D|nr:ABC transporter ATP-binding protein [Arenibaculum pallidiluteum]